MGQSFSWSDRRWRKSLPIDSRLGEIVETVRDNKVTIVEAETGAGKTIRIGQAVLLGMPGQVIVSQLTRSAVWRNGRRIAYEMGSEPGGLVGWKLFGEDPVVSDETRLTLLVEESLLNWICRHNRLPRATIIWDEAHARSITTDTGLGLIKEMLPNSPQTRLVVTSATIDTKKFSEFFGGAPVISVKGRCFPVSTEVIPLERGEHHSACAARAARITMERFVKGELLIPTEDNLGTQVVKDGGVVLVHLPGKEDINQVMSSILEDVKRPGCSDMVEVMPCHAELSPAEQDAIDKNFRVGALRFVCGTDLIRSQITVDGVIGCIDSLQIKRWGTNTNGVVHLEKRAVSMAEADQAKGRAGRLGPGFYIACEFEGEYKDKKLALYPEPAIAREPLTATALKIASIWRSIRTFSWIDKPDQDRVEVAVRKLQRLGALDEKEEITEIGKILLKFGIDPERAKSLLTAQSLGVLSEAVVATAVLEAEGIFFSPNNDGKTKSILVEESILRALLANFRKGEGSWYKMPEPINPKEVDIAVLPPGISKVGDFWRITFRYELSAEEKAKVAEVSEWEGYQLTRDFTQDKEFALENTRFIADITRKYFAGESRSDFTAIVKCYRAFKAEEWRLKSLPISNREKEERLRNWCIRWFVNFKRMDIAEGLMYQLRDEIANSPLQLENGFGQEREFDSAALTKALASGLIDNVAVNSYGQSYYGAIGDFQVSYQSACPRGSNLILAAGINKVPCKGPRGRTVLNDLANLAAPVEPEWLVEVMPQLCKETPRFDHRYDPAKDQVVETKDISFVGRMVGSQTVPTVDKKVATETFCSWLVGQMVV